MEYSVVGAAKALRLSERGVRSAIAAGRLRTLGTDESQVRISEQEVERYRHRKKRNVAVSWDVSELPIAPVDELGTFEEQLRALERSGGDIESTLQWRRLAQRLITVPYNRFGGGNHDVLVRVYDQPEHSPAAAVIVVGDLLRMSASIPSHSLDELADKELLPAVADVLPEGTTVADVCWVLPTGAAQMTDGADRHTVYAETLRVEDGRVEEFTSQLVPVEQVDAVIGMPLETWPAISEDQPQQRRQWDIAVTDPQSLPVWEMDTGKAEGYFSALVKIAQAAETELQHQFAAHLADEVAAMFELLDARRPVPIPVWLNERITVPITRWRPSVEDQHIVDTWRADCDPEALEDSYRDALRWYYQVDEYSPTPDGALAAALYSGLVRVRKFNRADGSNPDYPALPEVEDFNVESVTIRGDVGARWVESLQQVREAVVDNSERARQIRALRSIAAARYQLTRGEFGPDMVDAHGVCCRVTEDGARAIIVRPRTSAHLDREKLRSARILAHNPRGEGGDLAVFLRFADGSLTLLPHRNVDSGVNFGYSGSGSGALATDIDRLRQEVYGAQESYDEVFSMVSERGLTRLDIAV
ncbi:hypothetical protein [Corynebacterium kalidii]